MAARTLPVLSQKVAVSVVFVAAMFISIMDITIVNVALPTIGREFSLTPTGVGSVSIGYLVALAVVIPASGWVGDRFGARRTMLSAIVLFTLASVLCGAAQTFPQLVAARVLQGVGGGLMTPVGMAMLFRAFPPAERVRASSILVTPTALAPALGPVLGGLLVTNLSWRWVFYVNLPIGVFALVFGLLFLREQETEPSAPFDVVGFLLSGAGLAAVMYGVSEGPQKGWSSPLILTCLVVGGLLLGGLVRQQLRTRDPLLKLRLLATDRLFRSTTALIFLSTAAFLGVLYMVALFFQDGLGLSALESGLRTAPEAVGVMVGAQVATRLLYPAVGPRRLMAVGLVGVASAIALMTQVDGRSDLPFMLALMFGLGYCMAHVFVSAQAASFARITSADTGRASTMFNAVRQLGGAVGVAVLTTSLSLAGAGAVATAGATDLRPYHVTFLVAAALALVAAGLALTVHDEDAESTRVRRTPRSGRGVQTPPREPAVAD